MKNRRVISLLLALCMVLSYIPSSLAADGFEGETYTYDFTCTALGLSSQVAHLAQTNTTTATDGHYYTSQNAYKNSNKWVLVSRRSGYSGFTRTVFMDFTLSSAGTLPAANTNNGFIIKLNVPTTGKFSPSLSYNKHAKGMKLKLYLVPVETEGFEASKIALAQESTPYVSTAIDLAKAAGDAYYLGEVDTYTNASDSVPATLATKNLNGGDYWLICEMSGLNSALTAPDAYTVQLKNFVLRELPGMKVTFEKNAYVLGVGGSDTVVATASDDSGIVNGAEFVFESTDTSVVTVDADGKITAHKAGSAKIKATVKSTKYAESVQVIVKAAGDTEVANNEYKLHSGVLKTDLKNATIKSDFAAALNYNTLDTTTAPWAYNAHAGTTTFNLTNTRTMVEVKSASLGSAFYAVKVSVAKGGLYDMDVSFLSHKCGIGADVYVFPTSEITGNTVKVADLTAKTPCGDIDTYASGGNGTTTSATDYVGRVNIPNAGDYYVVIFFKSNAAGVWDTARSSQYAYLTGITLRETAPSVTVSCPDLIEVGTPASVSAVMKDIDGNIIADAEFTYKSSDESVLSIENGVATAHKEGNITITATAVDNGTKLSAKGSAPVEIIDPNVELPEHNYVFTYHALGVDSQVSQEGHVPLGDYYSTFDTSISSKWAFAGRRASYHGYFRDTYADFSLAESDVDNHETMAPGFLFKIQVEKTGIYTPKLEYNIQDFALRADMYLVPVTEGGIFAPEKVIGHSNPNVAAAVKELRSSDKWHIGTVTTYSSKIPDVYKNVYLKKGDYFLFFVPNGSTYMGSSGRYYLYLRSFSLKNPTVTVDVVGKDSVGIGDEMQLSWTVRDPKGNIIPDAEVTFESSDTKVLRVDAQTGAVTGVDLGEATVYAKTVIGDKEYTGSIDISTYVVQFGSIKAEAAPVEVGQGNATEIVLTGYLTNGEETDISTATKVFSSKTPEIVEVSENGIVTPLRAGKGEVEVVVIKDGIAVTTTVEITVTDSSKLSSLTLTGADEVGYLRDATLTLTGEMSSGYGADISTFDVKWELTAVENGEGQVIDGGIVLEDGGKVCGITKGACATVSAYVDVGGNIIRSNTIKITVGETDLRDFMINFKETKESNHKLIKLENEGWEIDYAKSFANISPQMYNFGMFVHTNAPGQKLVIRIDVPYTGVYNVSFDGRAYGIEGAEDIDIYVDGTYVGDYAFYDRGLTIAGSVKSLRTVYLEKGVREVTFVVGDKNEISGNYRFIPSTMRFAAKYRMPAIREIITDKEEITIAKGESENLGTKLLTDDGFVYEWEKALDGEADPLTEVTYSVNDEGKDVLSVDALGNITALSEGAATVTVTVTSNKGTSDVTTKTKEIPVTVGSEIPTADKVLSVIEITHGSLVMSLKSDGITLGFAGKNKLGNEVAIPDGATVVWESKNEEAATVSGGKVIPHGYGTSEITVSVTPDGGETIVSKPITVSVREGKTKRTYYTQSKVDAAQDNIGKYDWAKNIQKAAVTAADNYFDRSLDEWWNMIPSNDIPRATMVGLNGDPDGYICRYCKTNLKQEYSVYPWIVDPFNNPWKIQCPECKRRFPSNDFASLYNLVVEEYGEYNVDLAHKMNAEIVEKSGGSIDYLKNTAYPEVGSVSSTVKLTGKETVEGWGVDDGLGYDTGRVYSNGTKEVHTYLAYFVHFGYWYTSGTNSAQMIQAINTLADAYVYTGDEKYGRLGAVLIDRIADLYPDYEIEPWRNLGYYNQGGARGKILYNIWECALAEDLAIAYDALFPAFDDPEVIEFVSEKANRYGYTDKLTDVSDGEGTVKKVTGETLRSNIENNFLREVFDAAQNSKIRGNFGFHQSTVAAAGVVLDTQPDTNAMLDWVFNNGSSGDTYNTGGNISESLIDLVSRDGQGNESAPSYNRIWLTELAALADILAEYDAYKGFGIWNNPKYFTMWRSYNPMTLVRRGVAPIGDCGLTGSFEAYPDSPEGLLEAYRHAKELHEDTAVEIAQLFYQLHTLTNKDVKGIHYNIFTENPESVEQEIEDIIETHGEYPDYDRSSMLTGYGFAALRAGTLHETVGADVIRDTTRDFWMYFGGAASHSHYDTLNIGVEAYGISLSPDNGYPEQTGHDPNRAQWTNPTLSHNAVVVNEVSQLKNQFPAKPLHYDGKDTRVKVMDVDASDTYIETDEYRRTVVMVDYDDEISYGIDFFKVRGGNDHLYSFHAASEEVFDCSEEIDFFEQPGGSYAGIDVPFGNDPQTNQSSSYVKLKYPIGYTWLFDVRRADNPGLSEFFVDYNIIDMQNYSRNNKKMDIHLRMTMVNDFEPDEITLAKGYPPRKPKNQQYLDYMQYMLVRRKGRDLNTLFTTVIEPYNKERYIKEIKPATVTASEDTGTDKASAVKVTLADGRIDYIVYAQNNDITYTVTDNETGYSFTFSGFVGVWTVKPDGNGGYVNVYSYINDGTTIGEGEFLVDGKSASIKGCVTDFTVEPAFDNYIDVEFNRTLSDEEAQSLVDCMINVESEEPGNAAYVIKDVLNFNGNSARLDIGAVTTVNSYKDRSNINGGYNYDIAAGKAFEIVLSYEENGAPKLSDPGKQSVTAGSSIAVQLTATSDDGPVMFEPRTIPRGASIDSNTGKFTWKPDASQVGDNLVSIDAVDVLGRRTTQHFTVTVYGATTGSPSQSEDGTGSTDTTDTPSGGGGGGGGGGAAPAPDTDENAGDDDESLPFEEKVPSEGEADEVENGDTANIRFTDLGDHAWASDAINELAKAGIIKGTSETTFSPAANITRADFALLLVRAFNLESDNTENFADVSETDYFAAELAIARNTGIVGGIGDNKYAPRSTITRQDMMVIVYRALTKLGMEFAIEEVDYPDIEAVAPYAKDAVKALITAGLVNGKNGLVEPATYTTRAEVAVLVKRILDYVN